MPEPVLDDIASALRSLLEELHRVLHVRDLAEHEHADLGKGGTELRRDPDALVRSGRRHADVREHDVRLLLVHGLPKGLHVRALGDDVDVVLVGEDPRDALAGKVAVVSDQHTDRHRSIPGAGCSRRSGLAV